MQGNHLWTLRLLLVVLLTCGCTAESPDALPSHPYLPARSRNWLVSSLPTRLKKAIKQMSQREEAAESVLQRSPQVHAPLSKHLSMSRAH